MVDDLRERARSLRTEEDRSAFLHDLIDRYDDLDPEAESAADVRRLFLEQVSASARAGTDRIALFILDHVQPQDFMALHFDEPDRTLRLLEVLLQVRHDDTGNAERIREQIIDLTRALLRYYEERSEWKKAFRLLQIAPVTDVKDLELQRLKRRALVYEARRVRVLTRWLYGYLAVQVLLVVVVFPLLFVGAENGRLQAEVGRALGGDAQPVAEQSLSYLDGLYWSIITAASIGYGDITPQTHTGRAIAAILGTLGVVTIGVVAGLILHWLTPRRLD